MPWTIDAKEDQAVLDRAAYPHRRPPKQNATLRFEELPAAHSTRGSRRSANGNWAELGLGAVMEQ